MSSHSCLVRYDHHLPLHEGVLLLALPRPRSLLCLLRSFAQVLSPLPQVSADASTSRPAGIPRRRPHSPYSMARAHVSSPLHIVL